MNCAYRNVKSKCFDAACLLLPAYENSDPLYDVHNKVS